jgi:phage-related baseplate assembly protein
MSRFSVINLAELSPMRVLETIDSDAIISARMTRFVELWNESDPPSAIAYDVGALEFDPIKINQECGAFFELLLRDRVNQAARAITLAFGSGSDLDAIASRYPGGVPRLPAVANPRDYKEFPLDWESDDAYRKRIWLSPNPLGPHGTAEAYQFWALSALTAGTLRDVSTIKIRPRLQDNPIVLVTCLLAGDEPRPSTGQLLAIRKYIQDESRQAMTDEISVCPPKIREINYKVDLWFYPGPDATLLMTRVRDSVNNLIANQYWLGHDHTLMALHAACALSGVARATIIEPTADVLVADDWLVQVKEVTLTLKGRTE